MVAEFFRPNGPWRQNGCWTLKAEQDARPLKTEQMQYSGDKMDTEPWRYD